MRHLDCQPGFPWAEVAAIEFVLGALNVDNGMSVHVARQRAVPPPEPM